MKNIKQRILCLLLIMIGVTTLVVIGCNGATTENGEVKNVQVTVVEEQEAYLQMEPGERNLRALMYATGIYSVEDITVTEYETVVSRQKQKSEHHVKVVSLIEPEPEPEPVEDILQWLKDHDSSEEVCYISKRISANKLLIRVVINGNEFVFDTGEFTGENTDWEPVEEAYTSQEVVDLVYVVYHEVSGSYVSDENREAQCTVVLNRVKHWWYPKTIRKVITQEYQYESANCVVNRWLKDRNDIEKDDLQKCLPSVLRVLAHETFDVIPENVIFAAKGRQGSGTWMEIQGTYYCYE